MKTIEARVRSVIAGELGIEEARIASGALLAVDLGADSTDRISLTMALEDEFGIEIPDADAETLTTVCQVIDYITQHAGTAAA